MAGWSGAPASQTVNWDDIFSTSLNAARPVLYDNIFKKSAFWAKMHMANRKVMEDGGRQIQRDIEYAVNGTVAWYTNYDELNLTPQQTMTAAVDDWRECAGSVTISRLEERQNSAAHQIISVLNSRMGNLARSINEFLNGSLLAPTGTGLTAGTNAMNPLTALVTIDGTGTVHGINAATKTWWKNSFQKSVSSSNTATTLVAYKRELRNFYNDCGKHNDGFPNLALFGQESYEKYEEALEGQVRYGSTEMANLGFETLALKGAEAMWDQITPGTTANGAAYALASSTPAEECVFFLNTDYISLVVDSQTDLVNRPFRESYNQTAKSAQVLFMGNLLVTNRRAQGVLFGVDVSAIN